MRFMKALDSVLFEREARENKNKEYLFEIKVDGSREFWLRDKLISSRGINHNERYKHIAEALKGLDAILDGEVALNDMGSSVLDLNRKENWDRARYYVFDILELNGKNLMSEKIEERKKILRKVIESIGSNFVYLIDYSEDFSSIWEYVKKNDGEGVIAKKRGSLYHGSLRNENVIDFIRCSDWIKIKNKKEIELKIVGYEAGRDKGAFILEDGTRVSALSSSLASNVLRLIELGDILTAEVQYLFRTKDNKLFQPVIKRIKFQNGAVLYE